MELESDITGLVQGVFIVRFDTDHEAVKNVRLLFGTVLEDFRGRFNPGDWMLSSKISSICGQFVLTENSKYKVCGELREVCLPVGAIDYLRKGVSPDSIINMFKDSEGRWTI